MTITPVSGRKFGLWFCKRMGLDPGQVSSVTFIANTNEAARVEVVFLADKETTKAMMRKYVLVDMGGEE